MRLRFLWAALLAAGFAPTAFAGEPGATISRSALATMGFGQLAPLSDAEGLQVRGQGISGRAFGIGTVNGVTRSYNRPLNPNSAAGFHIVIGSGGLFAAGGSFARAN